MTDSPSQSQDAYLQRMKEGLSASAVLKAQLASLKSSCSVARVFAYEGVTDKTIYYHWIERLRPNLEYEPFVCKNKNQLLQLFDSLQKDRSGMSSGVYFFADRDFDDLKGRIATDAIFVTEKYSVENYLVGPEILSELLKIEFHCHGNPDVRIKITERFELTYEEFLKKTAAINFRIYIARTVGIKQIGELPRRIGELANVGLDSISQGRGELLDMVSLEREPTEAEIAECTAGFSALEPQSRYRGKFAFLFFAKWLLLLVEDRNSNKSGYFHGLPQNELIAKGPFSFEILAAKTKPPMSFQRFLAAIA